MSSKLLSKKTKVKQDLVDFKLISLIRNKSQKLQIAATIY